LKEAVTENPAKTIQSFCKDEMIDRPANIIQDFCRDVVVRYHKCYKGVSVDNQGKLTYETFDDSLRKNIYKGYPTKNS
jgi:hypothetical protein